MTPAQTQTIKQSLNKAYRLIKPKRAAMEAFKANLVHLLNGIDEKESEENVKIQLMDFLKNTFYHPDYLVATKGKTDLVIHTGKEAKTPAGVLMEVKRPTNKADMVSRQNLNAKALHELILYYLRERLDGHNTDVRQLVITNIYEWFIFDAQDFERLFGRNTQLKKDYEAWKTGQKVSANTDHFYKEIAKDHLDKMTEELPFTYFNIQDYKKALTNENQQDDNQLIGLYKILSPVHLLKLPFTNDSNSLDRGFYAELLHLIGLEEVKEGNKKLIQRKAPARRQAGSLLENAILTIESEDRLRKLNPPSAYGSTEDERLFNVALELCITWINRILFLKLLEAQLIKYHRGNAHYKFLNYATIPQYDELNKLFFQVLARRPESRTGAIQHKYGHVPYLNSSLFEPTDLEDDIIRVNSLDDMVELDLHPNTVLRDARNKPVATSLNALEYLLRFLDAYDFASEGREEIQEESKTLINAAVLGLIFEKINGYKDGSIYTPGFITMYMCRQAIRLAVVQKFNDTYNWQAETLDDLKNYLADHRSTTKILEFNGLINSLHICDPAVGSGHFLVSALNEIIAIKAELKLLADRKGVRLAGHEVTIENDELIITDRDTQDIFEYTVTAATPGKPFYVAPETQRVQQTLFHEKQTIIENCLFGVDINPNSVKICRLRLWIELLKNAYYCLNLDVLDSGMNRISIDPKSQNQINPVNPNSDIFGPELQTLPNIDINIKQGNSLLSRFALDTDLKEALRGTKYSVAQYRSFVQEYKNSHNKDRKRELENIINSIKADFRTEIYRNDPKVKRLQKLTGELQILTTQTSIFEPSAKEKKQLQQLQQKLQTDIAALSAGIEEIKSNAIYRNAFEWRFEFPEVLDNDGNFEGFDVVIGNPPYISIQDLKQINNQFVEALRTNFQSVRSGNFDIYIPFIELNSGVLKTGGFCCYILPNKFLTTDYGSGIREFLLRNSLISGIIDFDHFQIFEGVSTYTCILFLSKHENQDLFFVKANPLQLAKDFNDYNRNPYTKFSSGLWVFESQSEEAIREKVFKSSIKLKDIPCSISRGSSTGDDKVFVLEIIGDKYYDEFGNEVKIESEILVSPIYATDYTRYLFKGNKRFVLIFPYSKSDYILYKESELETRFPLAYNYLVSNKAQLGKRKQYSNWYGYSAPRSLRLHAKADILIPLLADRGIFSLTPENKEIYTLMAGGGFSISIENNNFSPLFILGLLNSKLIFHLLYKMSNKFSGGFITCTKQFFEELPIAKIKEEDQKNIVALVNQVVITKMTNPQADTTSIEKQIDELVYQLYELTPEEIAIVEGQ